MLGFNRLKFIGEFQIVFGGMYFDQYATNF